MMKEEYDFSYAQRSPFHRPGARLNMPVHLDVDVLDYQSRKAKRNNAKVNEMANDLLRKNIALIEGMK